MNIDEILKRIHNKKLYFCDNEELVREQLIYLDKVFAYNSLRPGQLEEKNRLLKEMFASMGEGCYIETPFHANWGGKNVHVGDRFYANFNLMLVDDDEIFIGNDVMIGPNVVLCTGAHPIEPKLRSRQAQYNLPIHIEDNVWLGASCIVLPGITIGKNSVIGAGSVVTKDIPAGTVAVGNPCRALRAINDNDRKYYYKDYEIDIE